MMLNAVPQAWKSNLPKVQSKIRGKIQLDVHLGRMTWFRVGGNAEVLFRPADEEDLSLFLSTLPEDIPITIVGVGSNLLVRDGGVPGVVVRLGGAFAEIKVEDNQRIISGAGALDMSIAMTALESSITGLEFFSGIPGGVGGALRMNAGAYGREIKDVLIEATALDRQGKKHVPSLEEMGFSYRHCQVPEDWFFTRAVFQGKAGNIEEIASAMGAIYDQRNLAQPQNVRTGGSTFANPSGDKAWELIDKAGCRGLKIGDAEVSEKHCNFLINNGNATAADIETLGDEVRKRVLKHCGVELHWEIRRIGIPVTSKD